MSCYAVKSDSIKSIISELQDPIKSLQILEKLIFSESRKIKKYQSIENSQQKHINFLQQDLSNSIKKFKFAKDSVLSELKINPKSKQLLKACSLLTNEESSISKSAFKSFIENFHYEKLTDTEIERFLPIWKNSSKDISYSETVLNFISTSIESKMKLDLLNSEKENLQKNQKKLEDSLKHLEKLHEDLKFIQLLGLSTTETNECNDRVSYFSRNKPIFILNSEDLYGSMSNQLETSTILLESSQNLCTCLSCQII